MLLQCREQILAASDSSTGFYPMNAEVRAFVDQKLTETQQRSQAALQRTVERSAAITAGITRAIGALPLSSRSTPAIAQRRIDLRTPAYYGLSRMPAIETIRSVRNRLLSDRSSLSPVTTAPKVVASSTEI